jgi:hypothetical protein
VGLTAVEESGVRGIAHVCRQAQLSADPPKLQPPAKALETSFRSSTQEVRDRIARGRKRGGVITMSGCSCIRDCGGVTGGGVCGAEPVIVKATCSAAEAAGRSPDAISASASLNSMSEGSGPAAAATFRTKACGVLRLEAGGRQRWFSECKVRGSA